MFDVGWAASSGSSDWWDNIPTSIQILFLIDFFVVMYILHKIYHAIFHVIYFGMSAYLKELLITGFISAGIVSYGRNLYVEGNTTGAYIFFIVILILPIIFSFMKKGDSD